MYLQLWKLKRNLLLCFSLCFILSYPAQAAKVTKVKGKRVYLKLSKSEAKRVKKGDKVWIYKKRKKKGLVKITKVKGRKAFAKRLKGKIKKNYVAKIKKSSKPMKNMVAKNKPNKRQKPMGPMKYDKWEWGTFAGVYSLNMDIKLSTSETVTATGFNFGWKGFLQLNLSDTWALQGNLGYQGFSSKGTATSPLCNSTTDCTTDISFLAMEGYLKYYLSRNQRAWWLGFGGAMNFPLSKTSTALAESDIGLTNFFTATGGVDIHRRNGKKIPVWFEYSMMPATATVSASYFGLNVGWQF